MSVLQRKEKKPQNNKQENSFRSSRRSDARGNHRRFREVEGCCLELYSITRRSGAFLFLFFFSQIKLPPMLLLMMMMIDPPIESLEHHLSETRRGMRERLRQCRIEAEKCCLSMPGPPRSPTPQFTTAPNPKKKNSSFLHACKTQILI